MRSFQKAPTRASVGGEGIDQQVARARAGHVQEPPGPPPPRAPSRRAESTSQPGGWQPSRKPDGDRALRPLRDEVDRRAVVVGGVVERDHRRLQPLGLVDGEDAHGVGIAGPRRGEVRLLARGADPLLQEVG